MQLLIKFKKHIMHVLLIPYDHTHDILELCAQRKFEIVPKTFMWHCNSYTILAAKSYHGMKGILTPTLSRYFT